MVDVIHSRRAGMTTYGESRPAFLDRSFQTGPRQAGPEQARVNRAGAIKARRLITCGQQEGRDKGPGG